LRHQRAKNTQAQHSTQNGQLANMTQNPEHKNSFLKSL